jgi:hypothetical protein
MYIDEFGRLPCACALQEREYKITNLGRTELPVVKSKFNLAEKDILNLLESTLDWTDFGPIRSNLNYMGKWAVSCILSYLISLGYVRERIAW